MGARKRETKQRSSLSETVAFILTGLILFYPPYIRGLFFNQELYITFLIIAVTVGILGYCSWNGNSKVEGLSHPLDYLGLILVLAYFASSFNALNIKEGVLEFLKAGYFLAVHYLVSRQIRSLADVNGLFKVLYFSALGVAFLGLATAFGTLDITGAFDEDKRITSTIQYANSLAVFLMPAMVIGYYLAVTRAENLVSKVGYSLGNYLIFIAFMGTLSRGGWLVFVLVIPLFITGMVKEFRWKIALHILVTVGSALLVSGKVLNFSVNIPGAVRWVWLALGGLILAGIISGCSRLTNVKSLKPGRKMAQVGGISTLAIILLLAATSSKAVPVSKLAPGRMIEKVQSISLSERNVQERFVFYKDAMKVIKEHPLLGSGGGAWDAVYRKYRSYYYVTTEVHNHYLKLWMEAGVLGLGSFLAIWVIVFSIVWRGVRKGKNQDYKAELWVCGIAAISLGLHSLIDFNLSLGAIAILLWALFGLIVALERMGELPGSFTWELPIKDPTVVKWALISLVTIMAVIPVSFLIGKAYNTKGYSNLQEGNINRGLEQMEMALVFNPFAYDSAGNLASTWLYLHQKGEAANGLERSKVYISKALKMNPTNPELYEIRSRIYAAEGKIPEMVKDMETALSLDPWEQKRYEALADTYLNGGKELLAKGDKEGARRQFEKVIGLSKVISDQLAKLTPQYRQLWITGDILHVTPVINEKISEAKNLSSSL